MESMNQLVGAFGMVFNERSAFWKNWNMRGQKVGNGQRVKMKVKASAWPLYCASEMGWPNWLVNL